MAGIVEPNVSFECLVVDNVGHMPGGKTPKVACKKPPSGLPYQSVLRVKAASFAFLDPNQKTRNWGFSTKT